MKTKLLFLLPMLAVLAAGCEKKSDSTSEEKSTLVETISATDITSSSALLTGQVGIKIADYKSVEYGMLISENESDVSSYEGKEFIGSKLISQTFSVIAQNLFAETQYYYRAYLVLNNTQYEYGDVKTFRTGKRQGFGIENGHEWIDLGLPSGLKWATCNVGATTPEGYGDYFAWGETTPKTCYDWNTYKYMQSGKSSWEYITKYTVPDGFTFGIWYNGDTFVGDNKKVLDLFDDAAHVNWGGNWRMPTKAEQDELRNNCTWTWTKKNGINGYEVKGSNGNNIFLPASGYRDNSPFYVVGSNGDYWSSSLVEGDSYSAYYLSFYSDDVDWGDYGRFYGQSVRSVCQ